MNLDRIQLTHCSVYGLYLSDPQRVDPVSLLHAPWSASLSFYETKKCSQYRTIHIKIHFLRPSVHICLRESKMLEYPCNNFTNINIHLYI